MIGRRVYANESGELILSEGDYGFDAKSGVWGAWPEGAPRTCAIPTNIVEEHEDRTITVAPRLLMAGTDGSVIWSGRLERGVWWVGRGRPKRETWVV